MALPSREHNDNYGRKTPNKTDCQFGREKPSTITVNNVATGVLFFILICSLPSATARRSDETKHSGAIVVVSEV